MSKNLLLTVEETAKELCLSKQTIYNRIHRKSKNPFPLKPVRIGRSVRFSRKDLEAFVEGLEG